MKVLFQGDSVTEWGRDKTNPTDLGIGYARIAADTIRALHPETEFEFVNRGIGGDKVIDLRNRWQEQCIDIQPDLVSIFVGTNDACHRVGEVRGIPNDEFESDYRFILTEVKEKTKAKIIMMEPFFIPGEMDQFREFLAPKIQIVRKLAREFADAFIPVDSLFAAASIGTVTANWTEDQLHPNRSGSDLLARAYVKTFEKLYLSIK